VTSRRFALLLGLLLLLAAAAGFVPQLVAPADSVHGLSLDAGRPLLLGWFGASALHNIVYGAIGLAGLVSARTPRGAVSWCRRAGAAFLALTVCGVVPHLDTMFGLMPLYGNDIWLNGLLGLSCCYFGWIHHNPAPAPDPGSPNHAL
jgi:hypothetical protein